MTGQSPSSPTPGPGLPHLRHQRANIPGSAPHPAQNTSPRRPQPKAHQHRNTGCGQNRVMKAASNGHRVHVAHLLGMGARLPRLEDHCQPFPGHKQGGWLCCLAPDLVPAQRGAQAQSHIGQATAGRGGQARARDGQRWATAGQGGQGQARADRGRPGRAGPGQGARRAGVGRDRAGWAGAIRSGAGGGAGRGGHSHCQHDSLWRKSLLSTCQIPKEAM